MLGWWWQESETSLECLGPDEIGAKEDEITSFLNGAQPKSKQPEVEATKEAPTYKEAPTLPKFFISEVLDQHVCRCRQCEPAAYEAMKKEAIKEMRDQEVRVLEKEETQLLREEIRGRIYASTYESVRKRLLKEAEQQLGASGALS